MGQKSWFGVVCDQFRNVPPVANMDLKGKNVVVVGANAGLGFEATKHFANMGAENVILRCRSRDKGELAIKRLEEETGRDNMELWLVDLREFTSVKSFAERATKELNGLDILMLNAAILPVGGFKYTATVDGYESSLQVNCISLSLLAILLLPKMLETAKEYNTTPRIVIVSSEVHYWSTLENAVLDSPNAFETLGSAEYCKPEILRTRYRDTKLLNIFFIRALNDRLKNQRIIVNAVNPGFCYSELRREMINPAVWAAEKMMARTAEQGSRQLVWAAVAGAEDASSEHKLKGGYVNVSEIEEPSDFVLGEEGKKREEKLWDDLLDVLGRTAPQVKEIEQQYLTG